MLYPVYSRVGVGILVLKRSVPHAQFWIVCRVAELNAENVINKNQI